MRILIAILAIIGVMGLASCAKKTKTVRKYYGPEVTQVVISKQHRKMYLLHHQEVLKSFDVDLGFAPEGPKQFQGDGKTPEGRYHINRRNLRSAFHLSLGISYPNVQDIAFAKAQGRKPGGDIFIHGARRKQDPEGPDWTAGCISVSNQEIEEIWLMVRDGTTVDILP
ncbi:L,D-transpeptidase family protein [Aliiroseovarius sp. KMU-50]|uniref:L,D-transpeptidase family protein n=1 Tax=Aliiroseovarius salicola TaxID=3009082 RepID=A0ABT4VXH6_9RHOB|nr:L,D-transpeptidase family protein [Aliiroseovarius sp. KMU-50]MDA5092955.1 L,D-transpeptidase family protein [Aliiroseovarius sp. KMU-50]